MVGSRGLAASVVTVRHSAVRRGGAAVFRALARQVVPDTTDTQCGFKFFSGPLARAAALRLRTFGFAFDIELIAICQRLGATLTEIPVHWQDMPGSTFSVRRHSAAALRDVAAIWLRQRADPAPRRPRHRPRRPDLPAAPQALPAAVASAAGRGHDGVTAPAAPASDLSGRRIVIANWRDPWHPEAGGAERYAWEIGLGLVARGATVCYLTARAPGQARRGRHDGIKVVRMGGRFTVYPLVLGWLLAHRRSFDAVLDCQNGIPFFTPWVLPRRVPVLCVMHHVHTAQFGVHFPRWMAWAGRLARRAGGAAGLPAARLRSRLAVHRHRDARAAALDRRHLPDPERVTGAPR